MIKIKSTILILIAALSLTGFGADTPQNDSRASDVLFEDLEEGTTDTTRFETNHLTPTMSTTQNPTTSASTTSTTTTSTTTTTAVQTKEPELVTEPVETEAPVEVVEPVSEYSELDEPESNKASQEAPGALIRIGMRGTYYAPGRWNKYSKTGGSGRSLLDCNYGGDGYAKGSIASGYLYNLLGYYSNGGRTTVWLHVDGYPEMDGLYYLDDCSGADVIDFFYSANRNCQFSRAGVVSVDVYYAD